MICKIDVDSWSAKELTQAAFEEIRSIFPGWPEDKEEEHWYYRIPQATLVDLEIIGPVLHQHKIKYQIVAFNKNNMVVKMQERIRDLEKKYPSQLDKIVEAGGIVHVHVPNLGLMFIDEVTHMDDACTNELQHMLTDGWRILAVCPPNAQRRPDYILGRTKEKR